MPIGRLFVRRYNDVISISANSLTDDGDPDTVVVSYLRCIAVQPKLARINGRGQVVTENVFTDPLPKTDD